MLVGVGHTDSLLWSKTMKGKGQDPDWAGKAVRPGCGSDQVFASPTRSSRAKTALEDPTEMGRHLYLLSSLLVITWKPPEKTVTLAHHIPLRKDRRKERRMEGRKEGREDRRKEGKIGKKK